jgi:hypothetical protein
MSSDLCSCQECIYALAEDFDSFVCDNDEAGDLYGQYRTAFDGCSLGIKKSREAIRSAINENI